MSEQERAARAICELIGMHPDDWQSFRSILEEFEAAILADRHIEVKDLGDDRFEVTVPEWLAVDSDDET